MAIVCFECLLCVPLAIFGLIFVLIGCTAKETRNSESSDKKSLMNLSSEKKEVKPAGSQMKKRTTNETVQRTQTTSAPSKETGNPPKAKEKQQKSQPPPPVPSDGDGAKQSKKSNKSKQASVKKPLPSVENTQKPSDDADQQQTDAAFFAPKPQEPNEFEKAAAAEGLVVNPAKVKRMGNIDDIYDMKKEELNKEFDNIKTVSSKAVGKDENKENAPKKVTIRDEKCKLFETTDLPTPDDGDDDNEEQI